MKAENTVLEQAHTSPRENASDIGGTKRTDVFGFSENLKALLPEFLFAAAIIAFLFAFFWPAVVSGPSMEPTFYSGDYLIISRASAWTSNLKANDFVACKINDGTKDISIIKRLVAVEGDTVTVKDGRVSVNGTECDQHDEGVVYHIPDREIVLGAGEYFVIGDNGIASLDSREIGVLQKKQMIAKILLRLYPFKDFAVFR